MQAPSRSHDRGAIHPYVREDLKCAKDVKFFVWTEAVLGLPYSTLLKWARRILAITWFEDKIIQNALIDYCNTKNENQRYDPFVHIANRIIELARGNLSGVGKAYPIQDFCIANNADRSVRVIPDHGPLGAKRRPDFLGLSSTEAAKLYKPRGDVRWVDILFTGELKCLGDLIVPLSKERKARRLSVLDASGFPIDGRKPARKLANRHTLFAPKPSQTRSQTRRRTTQPRLVQPMLDVSDKSRPPPRVRVGKKRLAEDDLLIGLDISSESQKRNPYSTTNELYVGGDAAVQSGSYALELLSCTYGTRAHCFSFVLKDDKLTLWYYDAAGILYTTEFLSLIEDFELFATVIVGFANCTPERFGVLPSSVMKPPAPPPKNLPPENLNNNVLSVTHPSMKDVAITLRQPLFTAYTIAGRRSFLYSIKAAPSVLRSKDLIVKFSYQVCMRKSEHDLVDIARRAGVKHLPRIHMWANLWNLSDGVRRIFYEKSDGAAQYEDRTLRAIVYTQYSSIKEVFRHSCELVPVMVDQMIDCLHDLRYKANMLHRDISMGNIMCKIHNGLHYFILIDFDMAAVILSGGESSYIATSNHRTGTLPFMAYELIFDAANSGEEGWVPIAHVLRHDYESLFWVALWCVLTLFLDDLAEDHAKKLSKVAKKLETGDLDSIASYKSYLSTCDLKDRKIPLPPAAEPLTKWFRAWNKILLRALNIVQMQKLTDPDDSVSDVGDGAEPADWETAGGVFTRDSLKAALSKAFPIPDEYQGLEEPQESDLDVSDSCAVPHQDEATRKDEPAMPKPKVRVRKARAPKDSPPAAENDIRSRLRPRPPRT